MRGRGRPSEARDLFGDASPPRAASASIVMTNAIAPTAE
jgi:hypothetical protein